VRREAHDAGRRKVDAKKCGGDHAVMVRISFRHGYRLLGAVS
jgi:hypothetical protein